MKLFYRKFGSGAPLIILHGLYGSSDNWVTIGRRLAENYEVWLLDQRNHGNSPHSEEHNYQLMKDDLLEFMNDNDIEQAILTGHSMGGKTAMRFAMEQPARLSSLIVIDIAPKSYVFANNHPSNTLNHKTIMESMMKLDFSNIKDRNELEILMSEKIKNKKIRQFILKNVKRNNENSFSWKINIQALYNNLEHILNGFSNDANIGYEITGFPVLFVKGEQSNYITQDDRDKIQSVFPYAEIETINNAGHWLHAEQPDELIRIINEFI